MAVQLLLLLKGILLKGRITNNDYDDDDDDDDAVAICSAQIDPMSGRSATPRMRVKIPQID